MHTRAARLALLILFLASLGTASYLFWKSQSEADAQTADARSFDASARAIERSLLELRSWQRSYVAAGQNGEAWIERVARGVDGLRRAVAALRTSATSPMAQAALDEVTSSLDDFLKVDKRAVEYVRRNQPLLASDVIFADGLELSDASLTSLERARGVEMGARTDAVDTAVRRGVFAITAGAAAAVLAILLMLPRTRSPEAAAPALEGAATGRPMSSGRTIEALDPSQGSSSPVQAADSDSSSHPGAAIQLEDLEQTMSTGAAEPELLGGWFRDDANAEAGNLLEAPREVRPDTLVGEPAVPTDFAGVASLCVDLARVVDTRALPSLLDRARSLLDASGIILWIADPDGRELNAIFAQGYPPQLINRLGTISRDAENATAAAFRTSLLQTVRADDISAGAIAAPLVTSGGCVGVMAAEVLHASERQDMKLAAATIVAAQLATLVGPPAARSSQAKAGGAGA
jgi:CHASE3 domain sensor protein